MQNFTVNILKEKILYFFGVAEILVLQTSVADPWRFDLDPDLDPWIHFSDCPDQDPAIFVIELQDANKKLIFVKKFLCLLLLKVNVQHFQR